MVQTKGEQQENGTIIKTNQNQYKTHSWFTNIIICIKDKHHNWVKIEINVWSGPLLYYNNQIDINSGFKAVSRWISIAYLNCRFFWCPICRKSNRSQSHDFPFCCVNKDFLKDLRACCHFSCSQVLWQHQSRFLNATNTVVKQSNITILLKLEDAKWVTGCSVKALLRSSRGTF